MADEPQEQSVDEAPPNTWGARLRALIYWTDEHDPYPYIKLFRIGFYLIMVWEWYTLHHGPMTPWERAFAYTDWRAWGAAISPTSQLGADLILWVGIASALAAITNRKAATLFAMFYVHYICTAITNFVNHDYLFALLTVLLALYSNTNSKRLKRHLVEGLRAQIVVVYAFASLWKMTPDWIDGTICRLIFMSFEEQGVSRGIPWAAIYESFPDVFVVVAAGGLVLDTALFLSLAFLRPGSPYQITAIMFHGFTTVTMSMRIGYAFPAAMIASVLLFQCLDEDDQTEHWSHARRMWAMVKNKAAPGVLVWVLIQWLLPLRMPLVSQGEFKHTMEGYRHSWTMMLHSKNNFIAPGLFFADLKPTCNGTPFPNPINDATQHPNAFPYLQAIGPRGWAALSNFTRQFPSVASTVRDVIQPMCGDGEVRVTASVHSSANDGPFVRLIDPSVDLVEVYDAIEARGPVDTVLDAFADKAPDGHAFILRGAGRLAVPKEDGWHTIVDRTPCLRDDPIDMFGVSVEVKVVQSPVPLFAQVCPNGAASRCNVVPLSEAETLLPMARSIAIGSSQIDAEARCADAAEDVVLQMRPASVAR